MGHIEYWENDEGQWYWHLQDGNNEIIADGAEGYSSKDKIKEAISNVREEVENLSDEEVDQTDISNEDKDAVEQSNECRS